jgi:hypothetical protein
MLFLYLEEFNSNRRMPVTACGFKAKAISLKFLSEWHKSICDDELLVIGVHCAPGNT